MVPQKYSHIWWMAHKISSLYINIRKNWVYINILNVRNQCPNWWLNISHTDTIASLHPYNSHWKYTKQPFISKYIVAITTLRCIKNHQKQLLKLISCDWTVPCLLVESPILQTYYTKKTPYTHQCTAITFYRKPVKTSYWFSPR